MFNPKYKISTKLLANIKRITEIITELNIQNLSKIVLIKLEKEAKEISAFSSTSIEGNPLPLTDVKRILKNKPKYIRDSEKEVLNYNKALTDLNKAIKKRELTFELELILKIQKTIIDGLIGKDNSGKIRQEPVFINNPKTRQVSFLPPNHQEVPELLQEAIDYVNKNKDEIDSLILAGIFHKQFVIIHPFLDGNGRTARLVTKFLLAEMGINTFNLFSFENYYNKNISKYFEKVGVFGDYYEIKDKIDFTDWLEYFTDGIIDELLRVKKELLSENFSPENELKDYHKKIIKHIKNKGYITDREYAKLTERAKPTRSLDFRKLMDLNIIERFGKGKATYYKLR
jgi:Fic family protein